jgi:hypothetical protein
LSGQVVALFRPDLLDDTVQAPIALKRPGVKLDPGQYPGQTRQVVLGIG